MPFAIKSINVPSGLALLRKLVAAIEMASAVYVRQAYFRPWHEPR